ncbi:MAG: tetratricopeptide repeat protein, partial [Candidatus Sumerlaeia bacterium]|nr:tetratricopeptide repeat protein [Candidatus Sumerlaeia bacterium]
MKWKKITIALVFFLSVLGLEWGITSKIQGIYYFNQARLRGTDFQTYEHLLRKALTYDGSYGLILLNLAKLLMAEKKLFEARDIVQQGLKSFTPLGAYKQLGSIYHSLNDLIRARDYFQRVLLMDPSDQEVLERLAIIAVNFKDFDEAQRYLQALERYHPHNPNLFYIEGIYYETKRDFWQAVLSYRKALYTPLPKRNKVQLLFKHSELAQHLTL